MMNLRDKETPNTTKQEVGTSSSKPTCSSSRQWSGLKNPRIVRVSRTFGGKDRHSKVCTIKGLRDRRIRLSVPTAIQLYDLQDRLGLNQPSKVIDWLLDTTKNDIDKLPPLPIVPGVFAPFHHQDTHSSHGYGGSQPSTTPFLDMHLSSMRKEGINFNNNSLSVGVNEGDQSLLGKFKYWDSNPLVRSMQKGVDHHGGVGECNSTSHISAQNFFPIARGNATSTTNLNQTTHNLLSSNNNPMYNYYHQWEPSNLSLTQLGSHGLSSQNDHQGNSTSQPPSSLSLSSGSQLFLYPPMATPSLFPPHTSYMNSHHQVEDESRQLNRFHSSNPTFPNSSNSSGVRSFSFSINHQPHLHQQNNENNQEKR